jgi:hypothetical protein
MREQVALLIDKRGRIENRLAQAQQDSEKKALQNQINKLDERIVDIRIGMPTTQ